MDIFESAASRTVRELAQKYLKGGGGQAFFATAGGSDASGLEKAVKEVRGYFRERTVTESLTRLTVSVSANYNGGASAQA